MTHKLIAIIFACFFAMPVVAHDKKEAVLVIEAIKSLEVMIHTCARQFPYQNAANQWYLLAEVAKLRGDGERKKKAMEKHYYFKGVEQEAEEDCKKYEKFLEKELISLEGKQNTEGAR